MSITGIPISILLIYFTKYCSAAFDGQVWPGRLIGFAVGAIIFALLSYFIMNEPFTPKTIVCLCLAGLILLIQIFWR
jgi:glucose uptake protein GlcU